MITELKQTSTFGGLTYDVVFKQFFTNKLDIVSRLLSEIINMNINQEDITFLNIEHVGSSKKTKNSLLDLKVKLPNEDYIIIEMQNCYTDNFYKRIQYYTSKVISEQLDVAKDYQTLKKVYCISFLSGIDKSGKNQYPKLFTSEVLCDKISKEERPAIFEYCFINLEKLYNNNYDFSKFALSFFKLMNIKREEDLDNMDIKDESIKESVNYVKMINDNPVIKAEIDKEHRERLAYNSDISFATNDGYKKGIKKGTKDTQLSIAKTMLEENINIDLISKVTSLSIDEIKKYI